MPKPVFIYCLKCPRTGDVRYIGKTDDLKGRLYEHIKTSSKGKNHLGNWLRSLGEKPILAVLHEVAENESWAEEERRYISCARAMGVDLVNSTDGGEGASNPSPETRAKISAYQKGRPKSPEHNAKNSAAHKGVPHSPSHCAAMSAARKGAPRGPFSPEWRANMRVPKSPEGRANMRGPKSPEHRAAIGAAHKGVSKGPMSLEQRAAISASTKGVPKSPGHRAALSNAAKARWARHKADKKVSPQ